MTLREIYRAGITFWFGNHYKLDAYVLRDGKKHPFALICPGGAYMLVSEENEGHTFAAELNRRGISAFVLHYRCRRKGRYPAPQQDVARALHEILAQADALHLDADNYSLWGSSAGGHLAASFATHEMGCRSPLCWCCVIRLSRWVPTGTSKAGRICLDRIRRPIWCS